MNKPVVVSLKARDHCVKGILTRIEGLHVSISMLSAAGHRLDQPRQICPGQSLHVTFSTEAFGDTPPIQSEILSVSRDESSYELTCRVVDWSLLAEFWARVLQSSAANSD